MSFDNIYTKYIAIMNNLNMFFNNLNDDANVNTN